MREREVRNTDWFPPGLLARPLHSAPPPPTGPNPFPILGQDDVPTQPSGLGALTCFRMFAHYVPSVMLSHLLIFPD